MSQETTENLNTNTLIGFTDQRGKAWHYRAEDQGDEANHYPGAIPIADVKRRLFDWEAVEGPIFTRTPAGDIIQDDRRKAIIRPDTEQILGVFKDGYQIHQYQEWLLDQVAFLLDDSLQIGSAGLLKGGAQAWVQVEVPENLTTPEGVEFRPFLAAATSLDGTLATTYARAVTRIVCDNTCSAALSEKGQGKIKVKHSRYSKLRLADAKEALAIVHQTGDEFAAQVAELTNTKVTDKQWAKFLDDLVPLAEDEGRARTMALNKRDLLTGLYDYDERVAPYRETAFGVVQAVNTYTQHLGNIKGDRVERNASRAITGGIDKLDTETLSRLTAVLA